MKHAAAAVRRRISRFTRFSRRCILLAALLGAGMPAVRAATGFVYLGQQVVPSGLEFEGTVVGGLSAIDYDTRRNRYYALSDDRRHARFYTLRLDLDKFERTPDAGMDGVKIEAVTRLRNAVGKPYRNNFVDPEGLRYDPRRDRLYWSDEGQRSRYAYLAPSLNVARRDGRSVAEMAVPDYYRPDGSIAGKAPGDSGIHDNLSFESVALTPDGQQVWTIPENGLTQDSGTATPDRPSLSRLLGFDVDSGRPIHEYAYEVAPVVHPPLLPHLLALNGVADMIALGDRQFLTLERSFAIGAGTPGERGTGMTIRLFYVDARAATDVLGLTSLAGRTFRKAEKTLLLDLSQLVNDDATPVVPENLEGISFGPCYRGKPTLLLIADDNFHMLQRTQIVALTIYDPLPGPLPPAARCRDGE